DRRQPRRWVRRDRGHQPEGRRAPPRHSRAPHRYVPGHLRGGGGRGEAAAGLRRRERSRGRARGVPADGVRRTPRGPGRVPSPCARAWWAAARDAGMSLIEEIEADLKDAMKERDAARRDALRLILNALRGAEKELQRPLHDEEELQVLQRERKRRQEAIEAYQAAGRDEQAAIEQRELAVLEEFMPEPLGEEEL